MYELKAGEALRDVAVRFLAGAEFLPELMALNKITNPLAATDGTFVALPGPERDAAMAAIAELSGHPRIAGCKDSSGDIGALADTVRRVDDDFAVHDDELDLAGHLERTAGEHHEVRVLAERAGVSMPICRLTYEVLYKELPPKEALDRLFARDIKPETD